MAHATRRLATTAPQHAGLWPGDVLFENLDGREVQGRTSRWIIEIAGIHVRGAEAWVQIAAADNPLKSLVVHLSSRATGSEVLVALAAWAELPADTGPWMIESHPRELPCSFQAWSSS